MFFFSDLSVLLLVGAIVALFVMVMNLRGRMTKSERDLAALTQEFAALASARSALKDAALDRVIAAPVLPDPAALDTAAAPDLGAAPAAATGLRPAQIPSRESPRIAAENAAPQGETAGPPPLPNRKPARENPNFVLRTENLSALANWLKTNWTLAIAALSLILGGLFMVQYGIENGILTPQLRVLGTLALGAGLIGGGEWLRRRFGDHNTATASLPSTLSGAGVVVLFIGVLSAHALYGLIGPLTALVGLVVVSFAGLLMGLLYGSALSIIGIVGAVAAPFLIGGGSDNTRLLYPYFALIALTGLAIDTVKRRAWISALAIAAPGVGVALLWQTFPDALGLAFAAMVMAMGAVMIPERRMLPMPSGETVIEQTRRAGTAGFPARLGFAGMSLASFAGLVLVADASGMAQAWLGFGLLILLAVFAGVWLAPARALADLALPPVAAFLVALVAAPFLSTIAPRLDNGVGLATGETVVALAGLAAALSWAAFWRMRGAATQALSRSFAFGAALVLPAALLILDFFWSDRFAPYYIPDETPPVSDFWGFGWAVTVLCGAALMVAFAQMRLSGMSETDRAETRFDARFEGGLFAASASVLITLGLFTLLTKAALTLALAVLVVAAALLYLRLNMAPLGWVFQLGTALIGYRLLADPGVMWSFDRDNGGDLASVMLAHLGPLMAFAAVVKLVPRGANPLMRATAESAALNTAALTVMVLLARITGDNFWSHWGFGLMAAMWTGSTFAQIYRRRETTGTAKILRTVLAWLTGLSAGLSTLAMLIGLGLLLASGGFLGTRPVFGPPLFDSLALALLPLAGTLLLGAHLLYRNMPTARRRRISLITLAGIFGGLWGWFEIRRLWRGTDLSVGSLGDGELYSYTIALLAVSLACLALAVLRRSTGLRKLAMVGVALTIAKVFLIDMSGLSGLTRVASFVGLGLALTGLAWLNRKITEIWDSGEKPSQE